MNALASCYTPPSDKVGVEIHDMSISLPQTTMNTNLVQAHVNQVKPKQTSGATLTSDPITRTWWIEGHTDGGRGGLILFDVAMKKCPRLYRGLSGIDRPTKYPHSPRRTSVEP
ncbi:hypothetical protein ACWEJ6_53400 [Nonomuraea sp. NPDC004702]